MASARTSLAAFIGGAFWLAFVVFYLSLMGGALGYWRKMLMFIAVSAILGAVLAGVFLARRRSKE